MAGVSEELRRVFYLSPTQVAPPRHIRISPTCLGRVLAKLLPADDRFETDGNTDFVARR